MYMVIFRTGEGKPGFHQAESLDDAVRFVERLRNQEQVTDASVFRMSEVPLEFKTYIKVEVADAAVAEAAPSAAEGGSVAEEPAVAEPLTAAAGSSPARFGRFRA